MQLPGATSEELFRLFANLGQAIHHSTAKPILSQLSFTILLTLTRHPCRITELTEVTGLDQSTISRRVAALCEAGLTERFADPADGRAQLIRPTETSLKLVEQERARRVRTVTDALSDWEEDERADLTRLLAHLNASMEARRGTGREGDQ